MTSRTSLFNWGICKNALKRFRWGSVLYFVILFFSVPFLFLVQDIERLTTRFSRWEDITSMMLFSDYRIIPTLLALVVPTIAAVLIFRYMHAGKQSVFVHGLPVTRRTNFISGVVAGWILLALPVLANGLILLIMGLTSYSPVIAIGDVFYWMFFQFAILFVMFSVAAFTAFLTGNTAAHIGINILLHVVPMFLALTIVLISDIFLYGFVQWENFIADELVQYTPLCWLFNFGVGNMQETAVLWIYLAGAVLMYGLGYLLYRCRKVETAGDVAAFCVFRPILKYTVTTVVAVSVFGILTSMNLSAFAVFFAAAVFCAIAYFACEMLMQKTFKVFGSYKGYCGFVLCCSMLIAFCAYTSIFGYETRVPDLADIESASVYDIRGRETPYTNEDDSLSVVREIHQGILQDIPVTQEDTLPQYARLQISYQLRGGKELHRQYRVPVSVHDDAMERMYRYEDYKRKVTGFFNLNVENVTAANLGVYVPGFSYQIVMNQDASDFLKAIKDDVESLSYHELKSSAMMTLQVSVSCSAEENEKLEVFDVVGRGGYIDPYTVESFDIAITPAFQNTYAFLKERGYYEEIVSQASKGLWICKKPVIREQEKRDGVPVGEIYSYKEQTGEFYEFQVSMSDCAEISVEDARRLIEELIMVSPSKEVPMGESYFIFNRSRDVGSTTPLGSKTIALTLEEMPDYLVKYLQK